jgi:Kef-type K+ transport system membrane component KefB
MSSKLGWNLSTLRTGVAYLAMLGVTAALFFWIRSQGTNLGAPAPAAQAPRFGTAAGEAAKGGSFLHVLIALIVIIATARLVGALFKYIEQPPVIGEVIAGILLGPSLLGHLAPEAAAYLLPPSISPHLNLLAQIGVILFMFLVGLDLDTRHLSQGTHSTIAISHASIVTPFLLGSGLALWLYPRLSSSDVPFTAFALFIGVAMSITAFPVLARILTDRGIHKTPLGTIALTCAAVDDVTAWCLLAFLVGIVQSRLEGAAHTVLLTFAYIGFVIVLVRPLLGRLVKKVEQEGRLTQSVSAGLFVALLLSALATELIGIHALFGAFLLGAVIPSESRLARELTTRLHDLVVVFLLPAFFAYTGLRTEIGLVHGLNQWLICGAIILVACLGKFGGTAVAARLTGLPWRESSALGILMNTRGLMQLIVLNLGLDLKVLSPTLFAMMVIMAVVTTVMTTPILHFLHADNEVSRGRVGVVPLPVAGRSSAGAGR